MDLGVDLLPAGQITNGDRAFLGVDVHPLGDSPVSGVDGNHDRKDLEAPFLDGDNIILSHLVRRYIDPLAVDQEVSVVDELTGLWSSRCQAGPIHDIVESALEDLEQDGARDPTLSRCFFVVAAELLLEHSVYELQLLLLAKLDQVLGFANATTTVFTRWIRPPVEVLRLVVIGPV